MNASTQTDVVALLNKRVQLGQSKTYLVSYLDRESGRLHDTVLSKICNAFFAGLTDHNVLCSNARVTQADKQVFAKRVDESREF